MSRVREAVEAEIKQLEKVGSALAESALVLAEALDAGAGLSTAAVARELRATLAELREAGDDGGALDAFLDGLRSPVRDAS